MTRRLVIDLDRCRSCGVCAVSCAYFYRAREGDHGVLTLRERAHFAVVCRRCEEPSCLDACRFDALERHPDGRMERHNLRCVSCGCCAQACPFGTIYPDLLAFYVTPCDHCAQRGDLEPPCVAGCAEGALQYRDLSGDEDDLHLLDDRLAVHARAWVRREAGA